MTANAHDRATASGRRRAARWAAMLVVLAAFIPIGTVSASSTDAGRAQTRVTIVHVTHDIDEAVYLADRVLVLMPAPGRVADTIEVALERPRAQTITRSAPEFLAVRNRIHQIIEAKEE